MVIINGIKDFYLILLFMMLINMVNKINGNLILNSYKGKKWKVIFVVVLVVDVLIFSGS